jgi:hypothetical protein
MNEEQLLIAGLSGGVAALLMGLYFVVSMLAARQ